MHVPWRRTTIEMTSFTSNCTLLALDDKALVFDPGGRPERITEAVDSMGVEVVGIYLTHGHMDHLLAAGELKAATGASCGIHKGDRFLWRGAEKKAAERGHPLAQPDLWVRDGESLPLGDGVAIHTPGHTPGSACYWFRTAGLLVAGDTLFHRGVGRTDISGGNFKQLERSITEKLFALPGDTVVIPGHGPDTTIGEEIEFNPFFGTVMK